MPNVKNNAYGLTLMCPIKNGALNQRSFVSLTRQQLQNFDIDQSSPLAKVPNTFIARFYILNDVFYQGAAAAQDHLKSKYLVFCSNFHGDLDSYLAGFWQHASFEAKLIWQHCVGFDSVSDELSFSNYIKKCQLDTTFYFNGSSGEPLSEQLKALYLKQSFSEFVIDNQCSSAEKLQAAFAEFINLTQPFTLNSPTWAPGKSSL